MIATISGALLIFQILAILNVVRCFLTFPLENFTFFTITFSRTFCYLLLKLCLSSKLSGRFFVSFNVDCQLQRSIYFHFWRRSSILYHCGNTGITNSTVVALCSPMKVVKKSVGSDNINETEATFGISFTNIYKIFHIPIQSDKISKNPRVDWCIKCLRNTLTGGAFKNVYNI